MNLPACGVLKKTFPSCELTLMVDTSVKDLFIGQPFIDKVMAVDRKSFEGNAFGIFKMIRTIRRLTFDIVIVSNPNKWMHLISFLAGIPVRVGYKKKWGFLLNKTLSAVKEPSEKHEIEANLELVRLISNEKWDGKNYLPVEAKAKETVAKLIQSQCSSEKLIIAVHPGTSNLKKRWPIEKFAQVCKRIQSENFHEVALIGGVEEVVSAEKISKQVDAPLINCVGKLTLKELTAFLSHPKVKCLVSADSGPVPIAWMNGTPTVVLFAQDVEGGSPKRWGPCDGKSEVIYKPIEEITPLEVYERIYAVLEK